MKLVKLSLVAALAAGSFSALNAVALEDAIKNVDISGMMRYRYDSVNWRNADINAAGLSGSQRHHFRSFVTPKISVGDGFTFIGQVMYNNDNNPGYAKPGTGANDQPNFGASSGGNNYSGYTITKNAIVLKQAYMQYDAGDSGLSLLLGKQPLNTIWTNDFTGIAAKVLYTPLDGLTIAAFAVDSFEGPDGDGDAANFNVYNQALGGSLNNRLYQENMYGAAVLANFAGLDLQLWGNYWDKTAVLYAVNLNYKLNFGGGNNVGVKVTYLGNSVNSNLKDDVTDVSPILTDALGNGNLIDGRLFANISGLDAQLGGIMFGKKEKFTINTLEEVDTPAGLYIGREIFYAKNSWIVLSQGQNSFGYVGAGYTLPGDVRIGVQGVFGKNEQSSLQRDTRYEISGDVNYKVNKNLSLLVWYSYLNIKDSSDGVTNNGVIDEGRGSGMSEEKDVKQTVRFQALYKF